MAGVAMSGTDTLTINNRVFTDFADGEVAHLTFSGDIAGLKVGKSQNAIYAFNATGKVGNFKIRVIRGAGDDKFLHNLISQQQANFPGFTLMIGEFVKRVGDGKGNVLNDTYQMSGGIFKKKPEVKSNVEGDTSQSVVEYEMEFSNAPRIVG